MAYIHRSIEAQILEAVKHFSVVLVTGPRQSGKSTMLKKLFPFHTYVTFDDPILRSQAERDPALFLSDHPAPVILDEIQYVPTLYQASRGRLEHPRRGPAHMD